MSTINTNVKSLISQNAIVKNNRDLSSAMQQLSTGRRINAASDDAAGLAITSRMTAAIRGLDQSIRNANDGISMIQTAEGALVEIGNMLQRMREISVQAANDTYSSEDRNYLDLEFQQLKQEIGRIAENTEWNGVPVLAHTSPNNGVFEFQVGAKAGQKITVTIPDFTLNPVSPVTPSGSIDTSKPFDTMVFMFGSGDWRDATVTFTADDESFTGVVSGFSAPYAGPTLDGAEFASYALTDLQAKSVFHNNYNVSVWQNILSVTASSSNLDPKLLKYTIDRGSGDPVEITYDIAWQDGTTSTGVTARDFGSSSGSGGSSSANIDVIDSSNILTKSAATQAIEDLDDAISSVNEGRANLGAVINRLTYAIDNLANVSLNTSESRSRIQDTDYAKASSELARTQIIAQAATAMLAQANQQPQAVLKLLQA